MVNGVRSCTPSNPFMVVVRENETIDILKRCGAVPTLGKDVKLTVRERWSRKSRRKYRKIKRQAERLDIDIRDAAIRHLRIHSIRYRQILPLKPGNRVVVNDFVVEILYKSGKKYKVRVVGFTHPRPQPVNVTHLVESIGAEFYSTPRRMRPTYHNRVFYTLEDVAEFWIAHACQSAKRWRNPHSADIKFAEMWNETAWWWAFIVRYSDVYWRKNLILPVDSEVEG